MSLWKNSRNFCVKALIRVLPVLLASSVMYAQNGNIAGNIQDPSGGGVPEATVTVKNVGTSASRTAETDKSGTYSIPSVPAGHYDVTINKTGFSPLRFPN